MKSLVMFGLMLLAASALFAQGYGGMGGGNALLVNTPKGLFALRAGVLAKYDAATLKPLAVFPLFGAAPEAPGANADRTAYQAYFAEMARRTVPAVMIPKDDSLLIIIGDAYARINQETMKVEAKQDLHTPGATADAGGRTQTEPAPGYVMAGNTLYLLRGKEMLALSISDGKILDRSPLPKELQTLQMNGMGRRTGGGGAGGAGGAGGGARGGAGAGQGQ